jgi:hypothetical protein
MKRMQIVWAGIAFLCLLASPAWAQKKYEMNLMTGPMGGSWYPLGGAIADAVQKEIPGTSIQVAPGGGILNVEAIEVGKADIGFSNSSSGVDGLMGRPPFKKKMENMRQWANLYPQYFQMIVLEGAGIRTVADLKGKTIAPGPKGQTGEFAATQVLQVHGLTYKDMAKVHHVNYNDTVSLMKDGHCEGWLLVTTVPASTIMDLASTRKIRMLSLPEDKIQELQKMNAGYIKRVVPKGTYQGVDYDVPGIGWWTHLVISAKLPDDLVYNMTKTLVNSLPRLGQVVKDLRGVTAKDLAQDIGIPIHPGALKYYKEIGVAK